MGRHQCYKYHVQEEYFGSEQTLYKYSTKSTGWWGEEAGNQYPNLWSLRGDQQQGILAQ